MNQPAQNKSPIRNTLFSTEKEKLSQYDKALPIKQLAMAKLGIIVELELELSQPGISEVHRRTIQSKIKKIQTQVNDLTRLAQGVGRPLTPPTAMPPRFFMGNRRSSAKSKLRINKTSLFFGLALAASLALNLAHFL